VLHTVLLAALLAVAGHAAELVDPTQPPAFRPSAPGAGEGEARPNRLTSIFVSPTRRVAVIDGSRVRVGDRIAESRVVAIELTAVRLEGPEGIFELALYPTPIKKRSASED
jgi:hypothetical protein